MTVPGFPSLFVLYGPNTNTSGGSIILYLEAQAAYIRQALQRVADARRRRDRGPPRGRGGRRRGAAGPLRRTAWTACDSWYRDESGRIVTNWPGYMREYLQSTSTLGPGRVRVSRPQARRARARIGSAHARPCRPRDRRLQRHRPGHRRDARRGGLRADPRRPPAGQARHDAAEVLRGKGYEVQEVAGNLSDEDVIKSVVWRPHKDKFGRLDVLVNNAGVGIGVPVGEIVTKRLDMQLDVNLRSMILFYRESARDAQGGGRRAQEGARREPPRVDPRARRARAGCRSTPPPSTVSSAGRRR